MTVAESSFRSEVISHSQTLYPFALNLTRNTDDAQDLVQETMLRSLLYANKFASGTNLKAWLYTIMRNVFINNYRRQTKHRVVSDTNEDGERIQAYERTTYNAGESNLTMREIENAMENISLDFSVPFMMHYHGYKYDEIAHTMKLPLGTVKSRIFFARKALQKRLTRY